MPTIEIQLVPFERVRGVRVEPTTAVGGNIVATDDQGVPKKLFLSIARHCAPVSLICHMCSRTPSK